MNFRLPNIKLKLKLDWNHILQDLIVVGIAVGGLAVIAATKGEEILEKSGEFSYGGLRPDQVEAVYENFKKKFEPFSVVGGFNDGKYFHRGIHLSKSGIPYYFHYTKEPDGDTEFEMYPMMFEAWTTDKGWFDMAKAKTGDMIFPEA